MWSAVDVIKAAGYPVEVYTSCKTDDGYLMEIVRIMRPGARLRFIELGFRVQGEDYGQGES